MDPGGAVQLPPDEVPADRAADLATAASFDGAAPDAAASVVPAPAPEPPSASAAERAAPSRQVAPARAEPSRDRRPAPPPRQAPGGNGAAAPARDLAGSEEPERGATAPQLRRFIKSRAYVPMHELRRRFAINGDDDVVTAVDIEKRRVYVGLPEREGRLLGELLEGGDIGAELSLDPITPVVVGVYPMRPVSRG